jgi:hypothetical protein
MATQATAAVWEAEVLGECVRCGGEMTIRPVLHGIELGPGRYLCNPCYLFVFDGSKARAAEALGLEFEGDDDGPEPDGGPAAPALAPVDVAVAAARSARPFTHLSELSESERAEYEAWAAEVEASAPLPEACCRCNRPASPYVETPDGPLCFRCWGPGPSGPGTPDPPRPDRATLADLASVWLEVLTELQAARERSAQVDAVLQRIR